MAKTTGQGAEAPAPTPGRDSGAARDGLVLRLISPVMRLVEIPMLFLQRLLGINRLAWVFLLPNLVLFGLFAFLPVILNIAYATTGGDNVLLADRPFVKRKKKIMS